MKLSKIVCLTLLLLANLSVNAESLIEWRVNGVLQNFSLLQGNPIELIAGNNYRISFSNLNYIGPNNGESYDSPDGQTHLSQSLIGATSGGFWYKVSFADSNNLNMHQIMENYFEDFNSSETSTVGGKGYFPGSSSMDSYSGTHPNNQTIWNDLDGSIFFEVSGGNLILEGLRIQKYTSTDRYQVTYAVPEPSAFSLLAVGLGRLALWRQGRKKD